MEKVIEEMKEIIIISIFCILVVGIYLQEIATIIPIIIYLRKFLIYCKEIVFLSINRIEIFYLLKIKNV